MTYRVIGTANIFQGDSRTLKPAPPEKFAVITDPVWPNAPEGMFDVDDPAQMLREVLLNYTAAARVVIILRADSDPRFLEAVPKGFPFFRACVLPYATPGYIGRKLGGLEIAYCFGRPVKSAPGRRVIPGLSPSAQPGGCDKSHPCARNIDHMRWLVNWFSDVDETVVDPFMGSGSTGVASVERGRHFIGIEKESPYFERACQRIEEAQQQLKLLNT